jgi:hydroxymethylpyrimidine/phosphomethylpyrimidine kinase
VAVSRPPGAPPRVLTIAGSDSGGGAGIEADIKTIERLGGYAMVAITAVTAQNTVGVRGSWALPPQAVTAQVEAVVEDLGVDAVKTGMLGTAAVVAAVADALVALTDTPLVVDPVMVAKGGAALLAQDAVGLLLERLVPRATLLTPNWPEAAVLSGRTVASLAQAETAGRALLERGARAVLVKGGHATSPEVVDLLLGPQGAVRLSHPRLKTRHSHGTGCTLSAAIATGLARGLPLEAAVDLGERFVQAALRHAPGLGRGHGPLGHSGGQMPWTSD